MLQVDWAISRPEPGFNCTLDSSATTAPAARSNDVAASSLQRYSGHIAFDLVHGVVVITRGVQDQWFSLCRAVRSDGTGQQRDAPRRPRFECVVPLTPGVAPDVTVQLRVGPTCAAVRRHLHGADA